MVRMARGLPTWRAGKWTIEIGDFLSLHSETEDFPASHVCVPEVYTLYTKFKVIASEDSTFTMNLQKIEVRRFEHGPTKMSIAPSAATFGPQLRQLRSSRCSLRCGSRR